MTNLAIYVLKLLYFADTNISKHLWFQQYMQKIKIAINYIIFA